MADGTEGAGAVDDAPSAWVSGSDIDTLARAPAGLAAGAGGGGVDTPVGRAMAVSRAVDVGRCIGKGNEAGAAEDALVTIGTANAGSNGSPSGRTGDVATAGTTSFSSRGMAGTSSRSAAGSAAETGAGDGGRDGTITAVAPGAGDASTPATAAGRSASITTRNGL